jgi:hypothetical protein
MKGNYCGIRIPFRKDRGKVTASGFYQYEIFYSGPYGEGVDVTFRFKAGVETRMEKRKAGHVKDMRGEAASPCQGCLP